MWIEVLAWVLVLVMSLIVLVKSADWFTDSAEKIGLALGIPAFLIGVTIVSIGTSLPELSTAIVGVVGGETSIVAANVVGSNLFNLAIAVGIPVIVAGGMAFRRDLINLDIPLLAAVTVLGTLLLYDGTVTRVEGVILVIALVTFLVYTVYERKEEVDKEDKKPREPMTLKTALLLIVGLIGVIVGAKYVVDSVLNISEIMQWPPSILSLTAIALGTSLPEVVVAITAARKKQYELAMGGIVGSNVFNMTAVLGIPAIMTPLVVDDITIVLALPFLGGITLLYALSSISKKIHVWEGALFVLIYALFVVKLIFE